MNTKSIIFAIVLLMYGLNGMAQESYREAIKAYLGMNSKSLEIQERMKPALTEVNKRKMDPFDEAESERLIIIRQGI